MTRTTCRLTAKNRDQLQNPTLGNQVWATFTFFIVFVKCMALTNTGGTSCDGDFCLDLLLVWQSVCVIVVWQPTMLSFTVTGVFRESEFHLWTSLDNVSVNCCYCIQFFNQLFRNCFKFKCSWKLADLSRVRPFWSAVPTFASAVSRKSSSCVAYCV